MMGETSGRNRGEGSWGGIYCALSLYVKYVCFGAAHPLSTSARVERVEVTKTHWEALEGVPLPFGRGR